MNEHISRFLNYIKLEKRFSINTAIAYQSDLVQFAQYLFNTYEMDDLAAANHLVIRSWTVSMMEAKLSSRSINRKITALKSFYRFLMRDGLLKINPASKVIAPKVPKRLPVFIDELKMEALFDQVKYTDDYPGMRDRTILELFYSSGMRVSELAQLKIADLDLFNLQVKVLGKRNKVRMIPISIKLRQKMQAYLAALHQQVNPDGVLFLTDSGQPVYREYIYKIVHRHLSGITTISKKSPHVLRHTFATHMLNNGADINSVKEILGHANLAATQVYTHNTIEKLKRVYEQAHPKA